MKGRKEHEHHEHHEGKMKLPRKHRETGGKNDAEEDLKDKTERYNNAPKIEGAAEERKHGGRTRRKKGGMVEKKDCGEVMGEKEKHRADRKPRKNGGRTGADSMPYSSARHGEDPKGHKTEMEMD